MRDVDRLELCEQHLQKLAERMDAHDRQHTSEHAEICDMLSEVKNSVGQLTRSTEGMRGLESDVNAAMRIAARMNNFVTLIWRPLLFVALVGYFLIETFKTGGIPK